MHLLNILTASSLVILATAAPTKTKTSQCTPTSIDWQECAKENGTPGLQCANISMPLDWSQPCNGETVRLGLAMSPAKVQTQRIGTLFFNTGGPGGQAVIELIGNGTGLIPFSEEIRDQFDIVAMDLRGIGRSQPIKCNHTIYNEMASLGQFPSTQEDFDTLYAASQRFGQSCVDLTGPLIKHVDSMTAAHDFEALRVIVGDERFNFIGLSYGTLIGQAYLEAFPQNVRTMALDGDVDHTQRQPYAILTEARAYADVLDRFFEWCDTNSTCALHNQTLKSMELWDKLIAEADKQPIPAPEVSSSDIILKAQDGLLIQYPIKDAPILDSISWIGLSQGLHDAYYKRDATAFSRIVSPSDDLIDLYIVPVAFAGDWNVSISTFVDLRNEQQVLESVVPHTKGICEFFRTMIQGMAWPLPPAYPERIPTFTNTDPVLFVNAYHDPETSYDWAVALQNEVPDSVLVTRKVLAIRVMSTKAMLTI